MPSSVAVVDPARPSPPPPQFRNHKLVYRRYAGLFFSFCVDSNDNELVWLEAIHLFVEVLGELLLGWGSGPGLARARACDAATWAIGRHERQHID